VSQAANFSRPIMARTGNARPSGHGPSAVVPPPAPASFPCLLPCAMRSSSSFYNYDSSSRTPPQSPIPHPEPNPNCSPAEGRPATTSGCLRIHLTASGSTHQARAQAHQPPVQVTGVGRSLLRTVQGSQAAGGGRLAAGWAFSALGKA
jgi:hypothetical protein